MPENDKIWQKKFEASNLENENWLEPSDKVLSEIKRRVHNKNNHKRYLWLVLLILPVFFVVKECNFKPQVEVNEKINIAVSEKPNLSEPLKTSSEETIEDKIAGNQSKINHQIQIPSISNSSSNNSSKISFTNEIPDYSAALDYEPDSKISEQSKTYQDKLMSSERTIEKEFTPPSDGFKNLAQLSYLNLPKLLISGNERNVSTLPFVDSKVEHNKFKKNAFALGFGYNFWNYRLNNNYETALNPADFTHTNGQGFSINSQYSRKLNSKVRVNFSFNYASIFSKSGHNSSIEYHLMDEMNAIPENEIDLTMASPLGFIASNIIIERQSQLATNDYALTIAVHNEHRIHNFSFNPTFELLFITKPKFELSGYIGGGINWISGIQNKLEAFDTNDHGFISKSGDITSAQNSINNFTYFSTAGLTARRHLLSGYFIGSSVNGFQNFLPIYSEADFSTTISGLGIQFFIGRNF